MKTGKYIQQKILTKEDAIRRVTQWHTFGKTFAFTNGCFDILHIGHIASLSATAEHADFLMVGLNSDSSVKLLKGEGRPMNTETDRAYMLASLSMVDAIVIFNEETPLELIKLLKPDFLVKGGDYKIEQIAGANEVIEYGGQVILNPIIEGYSTSSTINKLKESK